jgi:anion-transporting  ArsA/GET3 family ATPase
MMDLDAWLAKTKLVVCVGSGGVGKTTTAAAIGLRGALKGRKAIVLTIDPAKRLANSLGLDAMGGEPTRIDLSALPDAGGELWAMMLDSRGTFDALIANVSPSPEARDRILKNHIYRNMADAFAGSQDYMATEKLYDLASAGRWDLVVLDTPPVKNALDFLESPGKVVTFLDERILSWFLAPYERKNVWGGRLLAGTSAFMFKLLGYVFGKEFLDDLAEFLQDFRGLYDGFRHRHQSVMSMMRASDTSFVTVCAPTESSIDVARFFQIELAKRDLPRAGVVVNQVHRCDAADDDANAALGAAVARLSTDLPAATGATLLARLGRAHVRLRALVEAEHALAGSLRAAAKGGGFYQEVPRIEGEVHDLTSLRAVGEYLFGAPAEEA